MISAVPRTGGRSARSAGRRRESVGTNFAARHIVDVILLLRALITPRQRQQRLRQYDRMDVFFLWLPAGGRGLAGRRPIPPWALRPWSRRLPPRSRRQPKIIVAGSSLIERPAASSTPTLPISMCIRLAIGATRDRSRLGRRITTHSFRRHAIAKHLGKTGTPPSEVQGMLGHKIHSARTTVVRARHGPDHVSEARRSIGGMIQ